ncbi:GTP 3',8-cyclase MoaA [Thermoplasma sp.]|uniref:GTP 3',8-cyclase MoaA n=1 Tax=Thermoplasma sp. TaxID=1973142 RepID=UPI00128170F1|nr:GTP 3',8-cyclase MoaA [Thermoplasma sp.]KAA8922245.1 MAG: GTP 3',8-cyclase MoaA [Thermoplasma sp.]
MPLFDRYGRPVLSLRIQLNTTCNFKCFFCHMEGTDINGEELTPEEIEKVVKIAHDFGVNKVKITGGEPTLREDIVEIISRIRRHITGNISMTTNGTMLPKIAKDLKMAGLDRVNISLHSPDDERFQFITGTRMIGRVLEAVRSANQAGLTPVKINFVVLKDLNVNDIPRMLEMAAENNAILQLIEYETDREGENSEEYRKYHISLTPIEDDIKRRSIGVEYNDLHNRPRYLMKNDHGIVKVEFVKPQRNPDFCAHCTRLRITSRGEFKTCLMRSDTNIPFKGVSDEEKLKELFKMAVSLREPYWKPGDEQAEETYGTAVFDSK